MKRLILLVMICAGNASAGENYCFAEAAKKYSLNEDVLKAIAHTESRFNSNAISPPNKNGTYDIGVMQINSSNLPQLSKYGITQASLMDACTNIHVGAWVLRQKVNVYGNNLKAIAHYNSSDPVAQALYLKKIGYSINVISGKQPPAVPDNAFITSHSAKVQTYVAQNLY
jgi:soluble lytic murein transglycosylase-like protein